MTRLTFIFLLFGLSSFGQIKPSIYNEKSDTLFIGKAWIVSYSQLIVNANNTFTYNHRTSEGCLLWYEIKGTWFTKSNKLYLADTALMQSNSYDTTSGVRITVLKIHKNGLTYFNSYFDGEKVGFAPIRNISGNYLKQ